MAAWLYMHGRYDPSQIAKNLGAFLEYESIYLDILLQGRVLFPETLLATVAAGYNEVASHQPKAITHPFPLLEKRVANLLKFSRLMKNNKDYHGAISKLNTAIDLIEESSWRLSSSSRTTQSPEHRKVAAMLTDAVGMIGGHQRRLNRPNEALEKFALGRAFETNPVFAIVSSYNSVNWLVTQIELDPQRLATLAEEIESYDQSFGRPYARRAKPRWLGMGRSRHLPHAFQLRRRSR